MSEKKRSHVPTQKLLATRPPRVWWHSLRTKVAAIFAATAVIILSLVLIVVAVIVRGQVLEQNSQHLGQTGETIVARIGQRLASIQALTGSIATLGAILQGQDRRVMELVPRLLGDDEPDSIIAGGGLWPEPRQFDPRRQRRGFFWGRDPEGSLVYFDDYNNPEGNGYHHEEWYVPAKHLDIPAYWSRSYVDPYSQEPMVTCTVPYYVDNMFAGVATVDVKLSGLRRYFESLAEKHGGYLFAVDRTNTFLSYPDPSAVRQPDKGDREVTIIHYLNTEELAEKKPAFRPIADALRTLQEEQLAAVEKLSRGRLTRAIALDSYQIDTEYSRIILADRHLSGSDNSALMHTGDHLLRTLSLEADPILGEPSKVLLFQVPGANWKIGVVAPQKRLIDAAGRITRPLFWWLIGGLLISVAIAYVWLKWSVTDPIADMTRTLRTSADDSTSEVEPRYILRRDELGDLAYWFNRRTHSLHRAIEKTEEATHSKSMFLANMSHEIRTPMNGILGAAQLLEQSELDAEQEELARIISHSSVALLAILNDILDLSKIEEGAFRIEKTTFVIPDIFTDIAHLVRPMAEDKGIAFDLRMTDRLPRHGEGDPVRIRQIILNITSNAIKFTAEGGVIVSVDAEPSGEDHIDLLVTVADTGIGIPRAELDHIFDAFAQVDESVGRRFGGTGLGLSISKRLCELMGGSIEATSRVGVGSTFQLKLPLAVADDARSRPEVTVSLSDRRYQGTVLLVEDNHVNQKVARSMLEKLGFSVIIASNGEQALAKCSEHGEFDLILIDLQMPVMDGITATMRIREDELVAPEIPIIALTANAFVENRSQCTEAGMNGFLAKPITIRDLVDEVDRWLG